MLKVNIQQILHNKFNFLLTVLMLIILLYPLTLRGESRFPINSALFMIALAPALYVTLSLKYFILMIILEIALFLLRAITVYLVPSLASDVFFVVLICYSFLLALFIIILIKKISSEDIVTADTIKGGISVYFLLGLFFQSVYLVIYKINPYAYLNITDPNLDTFYYSFTTLTTLGYGDIIPNTPYAKLLGTIQACAGQIYLAIFISQIIARHMHQKHMDRQ